jgi:hypothetical protein
LNFLKKNLEHYAKFWYDFQFSSPYPTFKTRVFPLLAISSNPRVNQLVIEYLRIQGRSDPRARFCVGVWKKTWTPCLGASNTLIIVKNGLKWKSYGPPKVKGVKNKKIQTIEYYKGRFPNTQNIPCMLLYCY